MPSCRTPRRRPCPTPSFTSRQAAHDRGVRPSWVGACLPLRQHSGDISCFVPTCSDPRAREEVHRVWPLGPPFFLAHARYPRDLWRPRASPMLLLCRIRTALCTAASPHLLLVRVPPSLPLPTVLYPAFWPSLPLPPPLTLPPTPLLLTHHHTDHHASRQLQAWPTCSWSCAHPSQGRSCWTLPAAY